MAVAHIYSDLSLFQPTKKALVVDVASVVQHISLILLTVKGTKFFARDVGCEFEDVLFELMDDLTVARIERAVWESILKQEPRVEMIMAESKITPNYEEHKYEVDLYFKIRGLGDDKFEYHGTIYAGE